MLLPYSAAVVWELPQRDLGGLLPDWDELCEQVGRVRSASEPGRCAFEVSVGENAMEFTPDEVVGLVRDVLARAASL
ncbi:MULTISPECIES: hypothetical protein [unclassified Nonomuraea]|uniref:hypothetical protein n=1 Tax=unclassified Nonomuraea TaxID=2593643 RepID=UPI0033D72FC3